MEQLVDSAAFSAWATRLTRPFNFTSPFDRRDFALLLFVGGEAVTADERNAISKAVVAGGCRYAVCAGSDCSSWDDAIDWAYIATDPKDDSAFVMTTWHEEQPIEEVAEFLVFSATYERLGDPPPRRYLVACIGDEAAYVAARDAVREQLRLRSGQQ
ncbi:MAG: hypothetical protein ACK5UQ_17760 [Planctomycetota bacterium]|jgi:hypothetical protein